MVYNISLTLLLVLSLSCILVIVYFTLVKFRKRKNLRELIAEIENNLLEVKTSLESIKLILAPKTQKKKKMRKYG